MQEINASANPFPGLRPFESTETHLFFGRDGQSEELLRRLKRTRFLAVVGTSGSGKSSLVRAGLLPALQGGLMASAGSDWRIAILRPGGDPIGNLARSLASPIVLGSPDDNKEDMQAVLAETTLRRSSLGLVELVRRARTKLDAGGQPIIADYENLLVVVDQFEELFRFKQLIEEENSQEDAAAFVKLLLEAVRQQDEQKIYIVLTMRSDFLGDCSQFWELPEAINNGQYLIPRMTRDERREAITGPVAVGEGTISEPLVNQLLNDVGDNPDQLPILQHALMRTWNYWLDQRSDGESIDIPHYEAIGGMNSALSRHADEAYEELSAAQKVIAEKLFKGLTEKGTDNREIRRPMEVHEICDLTGASEAEVIAVIEVFRREGRSFLMPPPKDALTGAPVHLNKDSLIDISHESLIRNWERLKTWTDEEAQAARIYRRLAETAVLHKAGEEALLKDPALQVSLDWRDKNKPNAVWARRYRPEFETAISFLDASITARDAETQERERQRKREASYKRTRLFSFLLLLLCILAVGALAYAFVQKRQAISALLQTESALALTREAKNEALEKAQLARVKEAEAQIQSDEADKQKALAEQQREEAEKARASAEHQTIIARDSLKKAEAERRRAETAMVEIQAKQKQVEELKKLIPARINISTSPSGYPLSIDGKPAGVTTDYARSINLIEEGVHTVEIMFPDQRWVKEVSLSKGHMYCLSLSYKSKVTTLTSGEVLEKGNVAANLEECGEMGASPVFKTRFGARFRR
jgi:flagellar biosynthesis GTPase FlhF